ncbi:hypothetical protein ZHAS_00021309 [Anopheles sinensis]|uniref:SCP domain-containing protein n=1 Tax=Anopheles sinensis TaxID=74873 RepID=A0A084WRW9_ANOSI|nr:hypothetical protein ZHAS_00021309 [Anopheles sinensis]
MAKIYSLGQAEIDLILSTLNTLRDDVSSGSFATIGFSYAARMVALIWDDELAAQAGNKARTCEYSFDACRNTAKYPSVGQVVAMYTPTDPSDKAGSLTNFLKNRPLKGDVQTAALDDWGNVLSDKAVAIGCAVEQFTESGSIRHLIVCNISAATTVGQRIYRKGTGGDLCTTGFDSEYNTLCSPNEPI